MSDLEWYAVERDGSPVLNGNRLTADQANAMAAQAACDINSPLTVVRYTRTEVREYTRTVTVSSTDLPVAP